MKKTNVSTRLDAMVYEMLNHHQEMVTKMIRDHLDYDEALETTPEGDAFAEARLQLYIELMALEIAAGR